MARPAKEKEVNNPLDKLLDQLNQKYGKGTLINGKDLPEELEFTPTGSFGLDIATSIGGIPTGKLLEMFGPESSGKSTMALHFIAEYQKKGKRCLLVDSEYSFDKAYAQAIGVNTDEMLYSQPECMEDAYNIMETVIKSNQVNLIIFDSHTSCMPRKIIEGEVGDATMALQARLNSTALAKLHQILGQYNCTMVGISQIRQNIGGYGDPNVTTGGLAWKFYSDMRFKVSKSNDKVNGQNKTTVEVIKNKCGVPFGKAEFMIKWGVGVDRQQEIIDLAVEHNFIKLGGAGWYTIAEDTKVQGDNNLKQYLNDNQDYAKELETKVLNAINPNYESENKEIVA
jgi:recombination protein RecA